MGSGSEALAQMRNEVIKCLLQFPIVRRATPRFPAPPINDRRIGNVRRRLPTTSNGEDAEDGFTGTHEALLIYDLCVTESSVNVEDDHSRCLTDGA